MSGGYTTPSTNPSTPSLRPASRSGSTPPPALLAEDLWNESFKSHMTRLRAARSPLASRTLDDFGYDQAVKAMQQLSSHAKRRAVPQLLDSLRPAMDHLLGFSAAISTMVQTQDTPLPLVWGCIEILLRTAVRFVSTFGTITSMLEKLSSTVTRMNRYLHLLPRSESLQYSVRSVLDEFVGFCIEAIAFYEKLKWYTPVKFLWKPLDEKFKQVKASIEARVVVFDEEARATVDEVTVRGIRNIKRRLPSTVAIPAMDRAVFQVDFNRNGFFTGREDELTKVHDMFMSARQKGRQTACTVHSMGGVGKTQFALEYAYRSNADYKYVFWLPAQHGPTLAQNFASIAKHGLSKARRRSASQQSEFIPTVQQAKDWLVQCDGEWLLIYDNVEDWETIKPYWPRGQKGSILITSQNPDLVQISDGLEIALTPLNTDEGASLLLKHLRILQDTARDDFETAKNISRTLGGLPVAISHSAGYIEKSQRTLREFVEMYASREASRRIWSQDCRGWTNQYERTLETTWDIALSELDTNMRDLMNIIAMLDADSIVEDMLFDGWDTERSLPGDSIIALGKRGLVRRRVVAERGVWSTHRALQRSLLHRLDEDPVTRQGVFEATVKLIRRALPRNSSVHAPSNENWSAYDANLSHVLHLQDVFRSSQQKMSAPVEFSDVLTDVGNYLWERGFYDQGIKSLRLAMQIQQETPDQNLMEQSKVSTLLAAILHELGASGRAESEKLFVQALRQREQCINEWSRDGLSINDDDIILWANAWNDIACVMLKEGCYEQVDHVLFKSLRLKQERGILEDGSATFNFAENYKNLGCLRTAQGRHEEAIALCAKAYQMIITAMDATSAAAQLFKQYHAWALYSGGQLDAALQEHEKVRQARIKIFGEKNAHTLNSYYACGVVHHCLGHLDEAEEMLTHCLSVPISGDWTSDYVPRVKFRLAMVMEDNGKGPTGTASLKSGARQIWEEFRQQSLPFTLIDGSDPDEMVIYDHMVPCEGGRSTIGRLRTDLSSLTLIARLWDQ